LNSISSFFVMRVRIPKYILLRSKLPVWISRRDYIEVMAQFQDPSQAKTDIPISASLSRHMTPQPSDLVAKWNEASMLILTKSGEGFSQRPKACSDGFIFSEGPSTPACTCCRKLNWNWSMVLWCSPWLLLLR
jgi:hypothetical protein